MRSTLAYACLTSAGGMTNRAFSAAAASGNSRACSLKEVTTSPSVRVLEFLKEPVGAGRNGGFFTRTDRAVGVDSGLRTPYITRTCVACILPFTVWYFT